MRILLAVIVRFGRVAFKIGSRGLSIRIRL